MLFHLIYTSSATAPMTEEELVDLLAWCRTRNSQLRVTGMLLYKNGQFLQVLEGEEESVMKIFKDIEKDDRHKTVDLIRAEYIQHRDFPDWTMGFRNIDELDLSTVSGFTRLLEHDFRAEYFAEESVDAHAILLAFRDQTANK
ncbi:MAG: BLUF domain-containing protein [Pseudomonadota bacterium]